MVSWTNSNGFGSNNTKTPRLNELIHMPKLPPKEMNLYRFIGPVYAVAEYWIDVFTKAGGTASIRKLSPSYDSETGQFVGEDPYADILGLKPRVVAYANAINRKEQKNEPKRPGKPTGSEKVKRTFGKGKDKSEFRIKDKESSTWTPVQAIRLPTSAANKVQDSSSTNTRTDKKSGETVRYGPEHPKYGYDIGIKFNPDAPSPTDQYFIQKEDKTALTAEELEYCIQDVWLDVPETVKEARAEAEKFLKMGLVERDPNDRKKILNSPPGEGGGKAKKDKKKADYLGDLGDDTDLEGGKSKKDKKKDKGGKDKSAKDDDKGKGKKSKDKAPEPEPKGKDKSKKDKGKKDKAPEPEPKGKDKKKDKGGKADAKGKDKKKDKGGKGKASSFDLD